MHFTITLEDYRSKLQRSYGLLFRPGPIWVRRGERVCQLSTTECGYAEGTLAELLSRVEWKNWGQAESPVLVHIHDAGHARRRDLILLLEDLEEHGFQALIAEDEVSSF